MFDYSIRNSLCQKTVRSRVMRFTLDWSDMFGCMNCASDQLDRLLVVFVVVRSGINMYGIVLQNFRYQKNFRPFQESHPSPLLVEPVPSP